MVGDVETPANSLSVTTTSSNQGLIGNGNITLGGAGANRTITFTPYTNQSGTATITLTVRDAEGLAVNSSFVVTVNSANDAPTIGSINAQTLSEDTVLSLPFTIDDTETVATGLSVTTVSSNQTLLPNLNLAISGTGANRILTITPAANQTGTSLVTLTVSDGAVTGTRSFLVTVLAVNDLPDSGRDCQCQPEQRHHISSEPHRNYSRTTGKPDGGHSRHVEQSLRAAQSNGILHKPGHDRKLAPGTGGTRQRNCHRHRDVE